MFRNKRQNVDNSGLCSNWHIFPEHEGRCRRWLHQSWQVSVMSQLSCFGHLARATSIALVTLMLNGNQHSHFLLSAMGPVRIVWWWRSLDGKLPFCTSPPFRTFRGGIAFLESRHCSGAVRHIAATATLCVTNPTQLERRRGCGCCPPDRQRSRRSVPSASSWGRRWIARHSPRCG